MTDPRRQVQRLRTRMRLLTVVTAGLLASCTERDPIGAGQIAGGAVEPTLSGIPPLVLRNEASRLTAALAPVLRAARGVSQKPLKPTITRTVDETTATLTFEGGENDLFMKDNVPEFGKGFEEWLTLIDAEAGGTGNFANEPSPSTVGFWDIKDEECLNEPAPADAWPGGKPAGMNRKLSGAPCASIRDVTFHEPVKRVSLFYASYVHVQLSAFDADGNLIGSVTGLPNYGAGTNTAEDDGPYNLFSQLQVSAANNVITRVRINGYMQATGIDDLAITRLNAAPIPNAGGPYTVNEGSEITLDGSGSADPEDKNEGLTYSWDLGGGNTAAGQKVKVVFEDDRPGGHPVTLTVTDRNGKSASASTLVNVSNVAPELDDVAPVTLSDKRLQRTVAFTDPGTDAWTAIVDYDVGSTADKVETLSLTGRSVPLDYTYSAGGTYNVSVEVSDGDGGTETEGFLVVMANSPVTVGGLSPVTLVEGGTYSSSVQITDPDGGPWTVTTNFGDGGATATRTVDAPSFTVSHVYEDDGSFPVSVSVSDGLSTASSSATVTVTNAAPTASFSAPSMVSQGRSFTLTLSNASDPSPKDVRKGFTYAFDCGVNGGFGAYTSSSSASCTASLAGLRTVKGRIQDKDGGVAEYTAGVTVNPPPVVTARALSSTAPCVAWQGTVQLTATATDDDPLQVGWYEGSVLKSSLLAPTLQLPLGSHALEFRAKEQRPDGAESKAGVAVAVQDQSAPQVTLTASPRSLTADNKKYVKIAVSAHAQDVCTLLAPNETASGWVQSSDPDDGGEAKDGRTTGDIRVVHVHDGGRVELSSATHSRVSFHRGDQLEVRSERSGSTPRTYTIYFSAFDTGGTGSATETIRVGPSNGR